jgi:hypothetical protein
LIGIQPPLPKSKSRVIQLIRRAFWETPVPRRWKASVVAALEKLEVPYGLADAGSGLERKRPIDL